MSCYVGARFSAYAFREKSWVLSCYAITSFLVGLNHGVLLISHNYQVGDLIPLLESASGWTSILAISVLYSGLAHLIREDKPKVARFPVILTALPLLIVLSYPFAHETEVIDEWLFQIYEAGALVVALMIYGYQTLNSGKRYYYKVLAGIVFMFTSYIVYWFLNDLEVIQNWGWQTALLAGFGFIYSAYSEAVQQ